MIILLFRSDTTVHYCSPDLKSDSALNRLHDVASSPQFNPVVQQPLGSPPLNQQCHQVSSGPPSVLSNVISSSENQYDASSATASSPDSHVSGTSASVSSSSTAASPNSTSTCKAISQETATPIELRDTSIVECHPPVEYYSDLAESNDEH